MSVFRRASHIFSEPPSSQELTLAQWRALSRQVPLLYLMLVSNTVILAATHISSAPWELTIFIPAALAIVCALRVAMWWRNRNAEMNIEKARRDLRTMIWLGPGIAVGFTAWALSLYPFGDPFQQSQIAFYMGVTTIGVMFCLMHVRRAALSVGLCVLLPFTAFFGMADQSTFLAIALNMTLVIAALTVILLINNRDFAALVASRSEMARRQSETQRLLEENHRLANMDTLTGLPNRRSFERHLNLALAHADKSGEMVGVARIDLDGFKSVNEIFGQICGDRVIIEAAHRLKALKRPDMFLARTDGSGFILIIPSPADDETLARYGDAMCQSIKQFFELPGGNVRLTASAGLASSRPGDTADSLFDRADYATSFAKREVRGTAVVFSKDHSQEIDKVRRMEHLLHTADFDSEIYILLQPQYDMTLRATTGFEVLARWRSPLLGEVSPAEFIPMAERTGCINKITQTVLRKALLVCRTLPSSIRVSVNLSANDIGSTTTIEAIAAQIGAAPKPCRIDFEITETAVVRDLNQANDALLVLLALGARISLDDFGTGHSSLTHVQRLPLHRIKIDRSFVAEVTCDVTSRAIVKTVLDLCRNLGMSCVFEGVETEEQLEALVDLGGSVMQGYLFGRPMAVDKVDDYLRREYARDRRIEDNCLLEAVG
ncbi:MAG: EAL domain-containing protein [Devosia sp.]|nr:EAL domain-containing protein [Devosia sp.]